MTRRLRRPLKPSASTLLNRHNPRNDQERRSFSVCCFFLPTNHADGLNSSPREQNAAPNMLHSATNVHLYYTIAAARRTAQLHEMRSNATSSSRSRTRPLGSNSKTQRAAFDRVALVRQETYTLANRTTVCVCSRSLCGHFLSCRVVVVVGACAGGRCVSVVASTVLAETPRLYSNCPRSASRC